jgi:hypothetical protein
MSRYTPAGISTADRGNSKAQGVADEEAERLDGELLIIGLDFWIAGAGDLGDVVRRDRHGELNQIFAAPFPVCRHSLSTRRHGDP